MKNFNWFKTWFLRNLVELSENIIAFIVPLILLIFSRFYSNKRDKNKIINRSLLILFVPIIFGFGIWFLKAPVVRYGIFYINTIIFLLFLFIFKERLLLKFNRNFVLAILIISVIFNVIKNLNRISNVKIYNEFPFPETKKIIYQTEVFHDLNFNTPIAQGDVQSGVCWNTPIYCRAGKFDSLDIDKKKVT